MGKCSLKLDDLPFFVVHAFVHIGILITCQIFMLCLVGWKEKWEEREVWNFNWKEGKRKEKIEILFFEINFIFIFSPPIK